MGNSQSQSSSTQGIVSKRFSSPKPNRNGSRSGTSSPKPQPHRSLRTKKKSLELPDLALLSLTTTNIQPGQASGNYRGRSVLHGPPKSQSIPIPPQGQGNGGDVYFVQSPSHIEYAKGSGRATGKPQMRRDPSNGSRGRGRTPGAYAPYAPYAPSNLSSTNASATGPEDYSRSIDSPPNAPSSMQRSSSTPEKEYPAVVRSSIPLALAKALEPIPDLILEREGQSSDVAVVSDDTPPSRDSLEEIMVKISWHGGGQSVFLARAGDDDWKGRKKMERENPESSTFSITIPLLPGTHHLRFLVDDQWRVADDLPTAVDDQGSLANYVAVGTAIDGARSPASAISRTSVNKLSIEGSSRVGGGDLGSAGTDPNANSRRDSAVPGGNLAPNMGRFANGHSFWSATSSIGDGHDIEYDAGANSAVKFTARWTQEIPLELIEAAQEEETFLVYQNTSQQQYYGSKGRTQHVNGFVPLPNIPPSPRLPRHLDKLILNTSTRPAAGVSLGAGMMPSSGAVSPGEGPLGAAAAIWGYSDKEQRSRASSSPVRDRDREREARRRERERRSMGMTCDTSPSSGSGLETPRPTRPLPITTASGTDVSTVMTLAAGTESPTKGDKSRRGRTIDDAIIADDTSVLPVPSHVVLHHLCTSAIKNGVLAVGETVRYRKKYLTTIYYKPT